MAAEKIFESEYATMWYYPDKKILHHKFHKFIFGEHFRELMLKGLELFKEKGCHKMLSDDRSNSALTTEDIDWANNNYRPQVIKAGLKYWALVMPEKVIGKISMKRAIELNEKEGVTVKTFSDHDDAMTWLQRQ